MTSDPTADDKCVICAGSVRAEDGGLCDAHKYDEQVVYDYVCTRRDVTPSYPDADR